MSGWNITIAATKPRTTRMRNSKAWRTPRASMAAVRTPPTIMTRFSPASTPEASPSETFSCRAYQPGNTVFTPKPTSTSVPNTSATRSGPGSVIAASRPGRGAPLPTGRAGGLGSSQPATTSIANSTPCTR